MPRYALTANFSPEEIEKIENVCKAQGMTHYAFLRRAALAYCETCERIDKEIKKDEQRRENSNGKPSGQSNQTAGRIEPEHREPEHERNISTGIPEQTNYNEQPDDTGL